jgi:hypothetical protein
VSSSGAKGKNEEEAAQVLVMVERLSCNLPGAQCDNTPSQRLNMFTRPPMDNRLCWKYEKAVNMMENEKTTKWRDSIFHTWAEHQKICSNAESENKRSVT